MIAPAPQGTITGNSFKLSHEFRRFVPGAGLFIFRPGWVFEASIPMWAVWLIRLLPLSECLLAASCIHDWLYCMLLAEFPQERADRIFRKVAIMDGCPKWKAKVMYRVLRVCGWGPWGSATDQEQAEARELGVWVPEAMMYEGSEA